MRRGSSESRARVPQLGSVIGGCVTLVGSLIGARQLSDNSFLTHLATGREFVSDGFLHSDVFTWTSAGHDLVVQSWMASLAYGALDKFVGLAGIRLLMALTTGLLALTCWKLSERNSSVFTRLALMTPVLAIGATGWSERPMTIALLFFALTLLVAEGRGEPRHLALVGFVWIGIHGSWPLGIVLLIGRAIGARLDSSEVKREVESLKWLGLGVLAGGILNPYGPALLVFPMRLLSQRETLSIIVEWQAPLFNSVHSRTFLAMLLVSVVAAARSSSWRTLGPALMFVGAALLSRRNIPVAAVALIPVLAQGLPAVGRLRSDISSRAITLIGRSGLVMVLVLPLLAVRGADTDLSRYPVAAIDAMEAAAISPVDVHVIHPDFVGNYIEFRYGAAEAVWIDDRYELHGRSLVLQFATLFTSSQDWVNVIEHVDADVMLWQSRDTLVDLVRDVAGWRVVWADDEWTVLCRPGSSAC